MNSMRSIVIGGILLVVGWCLTFAGTLGMVTPSLLAALFAYTATIVGFCLGMYGVLMHVSWQRSDLR